MVLSPICGPTSAVVVESLKSTATEAKQKFSILNTHFPVSLHQSPVLTYCAPFHLISLNAQPLLMSQWVSHVHSEDFPMYSYVEIRALINCSWVPWKVSPSVPQLPPADKTKNGTKGTMKALLKINIYKCCWKQRKPQRKDKELCE